MARKLPYPGYRRTTHTSYLGVRANCEDCPWSLEATNALGVASVHADVNGHTVHVEQTRGVTYNQKTEATP
jgi:hypothetical protein